MTRKDGPPSPPGPARAVEKIDADLIRAMLSKIDALTSRVDGLEEENRRLQGIINTSSESGHVVIRADVRVEGELVVAKNLEVVGCADMGDTVTFNNGYM